MCSYLRNPQIHVQTHTHTHDHKETFRGDGYVYSLGYIVMISQVRNVSGFTRLTFLFNIFMFGREEREHI